MKKTNDGRRKNHLLEKENILFQLSIESVIEQLKKRSYIRKEDMEKLLLSMKAITKNQPNMILLKSPISVVGDIHGQFYDLLNIFQKFGSPQKTSYLFLGDYVDRGMFGMEIITLLMAYKLKYPQNVHLLRGNHECRMLTSNFNFRQECLAKYDHDFYEQIMQFFDTLPLIAIIDQLYFAVHAGISPDVKNLDEIQKLNRFSQIPPKGAICDFLWSDPIDESCNQWKPNKMRSCSFFYSPTQSQKFLCANQLKMILRGHEIQMSGYKYQQSSQFNKHQPLSLTLFSAPNYCDHYQNKGAIACINKSTLQIKAFKNVTHPLVLAKYVNILQWSLPFVAVSVGKILQGLMKNRKKENKQESFQNFKNYKEKIQFDNKMELFNALLQLQVGQNHDLISQQTKQNSVEPQKAVQNDKENMEKVMRQFVRKKSLDKDQMRPVVVFGPKIYMKPFQKPFPQQIQPSDILDN